jgi:hypothetical protein
MSTFQNRNIPVTIYPMKNILILTSFLLLLSVKCFSQDYLDDIAKKTCSCTDTISDTTNSEQYYMQLGVCMIVASTPYKKQIKKDYKIDIDNLGDDGEKIGKIIGVKMASVCPKTLARIAQVAKKEKQQPANEEQTIKGIITNIENDCFMVFSLKDDIGKITKLYWLTFIDTKIELTNHYKSYIGEPVTITYKIQEFFDPKINEYRQFFIISKIE